MTFCTRRQRNQTAVTSNTGKKRKKIEFIALFVSCLLHNDIYSCFIHLFILTHCNSLQTTKRIAYHFNGKVEGFTDSSSFFVLIVWNAIMDIGQASFECRFRIVSLLKRMKMEWNDFNSTSPTARCYKCVNHQTAAAKSYECSAVQWNQTLNGILRWRWLFFQMSISECQHLHLLDAFSMGYNSCHCTIFAFQWAFHHNRTDSALVLCRFKFGIFLCLEQKMSQSIAIVISLQCHVLQPVPQITSNHC